MGDKVVMYNWIKPKIIVVVIIFLIFLIDFNQTIYCCIYLITSMVVVTLNDGLPDVEVKAKDDDYTSKEHSNDAGQN